MTTNKFLITLLLGAYLGLAQAQEDEIDNREKLKVGFRTGLNYSNMFDSKHDDLRADSKLGFVGGAMLSIPFNKYFGIKPEIMLSQKGFKGQGVLLGSSYNFTRTTTYLDIPLQVEFKPSEFFSILAGPQFSYLLKQKDVFSNSAMSYIQEQEFQNDNVRKNIFGLVAGIDINMKQLVFGARAGFDLNANHGNGNSSTPRYKNAWLQATIGYTFYKMKND